MTWKQTLSRWLGGVRRHLPVGRRRSPTPPPVEPDTAPWADLEWEDNQAKNRIVLLKDLKPLGKPTDESDE